MKKKAQVVVEKQIWANSFKLNLSSRWTSADLSARNTLFVYQCLWTVSKVAEPLTGLRPQPGTTATRWRGCQQTYNNPPHLYLLLHSAQTIWKPSALLCIFLCLDMKWAHIINNCILSHWPPNKSRCSNKQSTLPHCLPLSGFEL